MCALGTGVQTCALPILWFFLRKYVPLSTTVFAVNFALFVLGALLILGSVFLGGYGGAWTFLYPLPVRSMGLWSNNAAVVFMLGYLAIGVGLLLFYLDAIRALILRYGNLRSERRRVGTGCVSLCRSWWLPYPSKTKKQTTPL